MQVVADNSNVWSPSGFQVSSCLSSLKVLKAQFCLSEDKRLRTVLPSGCQTKVGNSALGRHLPMLGRNEIQTVSHFSTPKDHRERGSVSPLLPPDQECPRAEVIPADLSELQSSLRSRLGDSSLPNYWHVNVFKKYINFSFSVVINGKVGLNYLVCHCYNLKS